MTKQQAAEKWVSGFNAVPRNMIEALWTHAGEYEGAGWEEITAPRVGDSVFHYPSGECGEIVDIDIMSEDCVVRIGDENILSNLDDITVEHDTILPMWGSMWRFGDRCDDNWLEERGGIAKMSECGFRIYEHEEFGYFFGIDGMGYSFYEEHWLPLYEARGLQWHDREAEKPSLLATLKANAERSRAEFGDQTISPQKYVQHEI